MLAQDLTQLDLQDLFAQEVSSVAKRPQSVKDAPAAVFVISREDIRRSGATTLPEVLRMAPGMEVAVQSGNSAAVTSRGFNSLFANKLLILLDGRFLYISTVAGVAWNTQLVALEAIERIEVVRGPGAALWGANAVNGVINIITKHAIDTTGSLAVVERDSEDSSRLTLRQGMTVGETGVLRLSGNVSDYRGAAQIADQVVRDRSKAQGFSFRYDMEPRESDAVTLQGNIVDQRGSARALGDSSSVVGSVLGRWTRTPGAGRRTTLQAYWEEADTRGYGGRYRGRTVDVDFSQQLPIGQRHDIVYGLEYRRIELTSSIDPLSLPHIQENWFGGFIQDDLRFASERLKVSAGVKLERHPMTGLEVQPSLRAIWMDPAGWSAWAAVSRAVRTPSNLETDSRIDARPFFALAPGQVDAEALVATEAGWRGRITPTISVDLAAFYNRYEHLIGLTRGLEEVDGARLFVSRPDNVGSAKSYGLEASVDLRLTGHWALEGAATLQDIDVKAAANSTFVLWAKPDSQSPASQFSLRSAMDLRDDLDFDVWVRRVGKLSGGAADAYTDLDMRVAWRANPNLEFTLKGQNLLESQRVELANPLGSTALVERRVALGVALRR